MAKMEDVTPLVGSGNIGGKVYRLKQCDYEETAMENNWCMYCVAALTTVAKARTALFFPLPFVGL